MPEKSELVTTNQIRIAERRAIVADLVLRSVPLTRIADTLDCGLGLVRNDIRAITDAWEKDAKKTLGQHRVRELRRLDHLEYECWRAFERSRGARKMASGSSKYLRLVANIIEQRCKLLGLHAPRKSQLDLNVSGGQRPGWLEEIDSVETSEVVGSRSVHELARAHHASVKNPTPLREIEVEEDLGSS